MQRFINVGMHIAGPVCGVSFGLLFFIPAESLLGTIVGAVMLVSGVIFLVALLLNSRQEAAAEEQRYQEIEPGVIIRYGCGHERRIPYASAPLPAHWVPTIDAGTGARWYDMPELSCPQCGHTALTDGGASSVLDALRARQLPTGDSPEDGDNKSLIVIS